MSGSFAGLLALVLALAWLQIAVLSGLPSRAELQGLGGTARAPAGAAEDPRLAERTAGLLLRAPTPALKRELQQRLHIGPPIDQVFQLLQGPGEVL